MENITEEKNPIKINSLQNYRNEYLFSEIYLQEITERPVTDENLRASLQTIKEWREYADKTSLEKWTMSYIAPVLDILGFGHHREEGKSNILKLFPDVDKTNPTSICYVVPSEEKIECAQKGKHWAEKIIRNLRKHNFEWGILTDGIYWRIYHTKEPTPYETYVEVNLESILNNQDYPAFQIFYFFFRPENFITSENGECKFDNYKEESVKTTEYIEENLRAAIEREEEDGGVLQTLCLGYFDALRKETYSEEERQHIYGGAILYLFRLLFLFYSTARDLLKGENIEAFKSIVLDSFRFHNKGGAQSSSYDLWLRLQDLFAEIDLTYDGGLFNPHESNLTQFIEEIRITDPFLSEVVFGLGYYQKSKGNFVPIEYRDLSVRHLGSLYEGLLEHNLFITPENTVVRKSGTKVRFIPQSHAGRISRSETIIEKGKVYFSEDAKERKLTGSYYTPEDVVEYIVKNTVDALLGEKKQELMADIEPVINEIDSAINESERKRLELFLEDKVLKFIEEKILSLSVLDPTMGSGHFLVNATNHIANFIVDLLNEFPGYNPKIGSDPALWRRRVVEDCIYGVDLNPLAVELAKLCLWITTAFKEKPLSFLNHHLKKGNALVGVRISGLEKHLEKTRGKYDLFMQSYINSVRQASEGYKEKLSKLTEAREDIEEKKEILAGLDEDLFPYKHLCNLFTQYLLGELKETDLSFQIENWKKLNKTEKLPASLNSKDFFHWDLEFPDVFYGNNTGFDCVIGNPPYVDIKLDEYDTHYKCSRFITNECGNLYVYTIERSCQILNWRGRMSFVIPLSLFTTPRMLPVQKFIKDHYTKIYIAFFSNRPSQIFKDSQNFASIFIFEKKPGEEQLIATTKLLRWYSNKRKELFKNISFTHVEIPETAPKFAIPKLSNQIENSILYKLFSKQKMLKDYISKSQNSNYVIYCYGGVYWTKARNFESFVIKNNKRIRSTADRIICIRENIDSHLVVSILNSTLHYWFWLMFSDCRNKTRGVMCSFPINIDEMGHSMRERLITLGNKLMLDYEEKGETMCRNFSSGLVKYKEFYPRKSKGIIDKIDNVLAKYYGLTEEELAFIVHYDEEFRLEANE